MHIPKKGSVWESGNSAISFPSWKISMIIRTLKSPRSLAGKTPIENCWVQCSQILITEILLVNLTNNLWVMESLILHPPGVMGALCVSSSACRISQIGNKETWVQLWDCFSILKAISSNTLRTFSWHRHTWLHVKMCIWSLAGKH